MRALAGAGTVIHFTHLSVPLAVADVFRNPASPPQLARADAHTMGVLELMRLSAVTCDHVCLLDPRADQPLSPSDGDGRFVWFLFGVRAYLSPASRLCPLTLACLGHPRRVTAPRRGISLIVHLAQATTRPATAPLSSARLASPRVTLVPSR